MEPVFLQHYDQIEIDDDEEDQLLDSDPEDELPAPTSIPPPPPPPPPPVARDTGKDIDPDVDAAVPRYSRKKGETIFPSLRIENILRADGTCLLILLSPDGPPTRLPCVGETGIMSREALLVLSLATVRVLPPTVLPVKCRFPNSVYRRSSSREWSTRQSFTLVMKTDSVQLSPIKT